MHDPEMRHGHKAAVAVDTDSQLVTAVDVLPGNAWDSTGALDLVQQSEAGTGVPVAETMGDTAYGDGQTRQSFAGAGRQLVARMPGRPQRAYFAKEDFLIDLAADTGTCPAGNVAAGSRAWRARTGHAGRKYRVRGFRFEAAVCGACPLRERCVAGKSGAGRTVQLHPQEGLFQRARALQRSPAFEEYRRLRVIVEHRLARLVQLDIRQARYTGRAKTKFQLYLAATVANLTLVAGKLGLTDGNDIGPSASRAMLARRASYGVNFNAVWCWSIWPLTLLISALLPQLHFQIRAFRPAC